MTAPTWHSQHLCVCTHSYAQPVIPPVWWQISFQLQRPGDWEQTIFRSGAATVALFLVKNISTPAS
jgi:hypothetical protein